MAITELVVTKIYVVDSIASNFPPAVENRIVYEKTTKKLKIYNATSSAWEAIASDSVVYAANLTALNAITGSFNGQLGVDGEELQLYVWVDSAWVEVGGSGSITLVANKAALPAVEDSDEGDVAITKDSNVLYYFNGTAWVSTQELITLSDKTSVTVGGLNAGTEVANMTNQELWEAVLLKELFPALTNPSTGFSFNAGGSGVLKEIGSTINLTFTSTFDRGSINPQYKSESSYRSGLPNKYTYTGTSIAGDKDSTALSDTANISSYTVVRGDQSWTMTCSYDAGVQPKSNKGNNYNSALAAGTTAAKTLTIKGTYPFFATTSNITTKTKQSLVAINSTSLTVNMVGCTDTNFWVIDVPACWTITGFKADGAYLNGNKANSMLQWSVEDLAETEHNAGIAYKRYSYGANGAPKMGATTLTIDVTYDASVQ